MLILWFASSLFRLSNLKLLIVGKVKLVARMTVCMHKLDCVAVALQAVPVCCRPNTRVFRSSVDRPTICTLSHAAALHNAMSLTEREGKRN